MSILRAIGKIKLSIDGILGVAATQSEQIADLKTEVRDLRIMLLHMRNVPQKEIAQRFELSAGRVSQIIKSMS